jgi:hypothetical protein
MAMMLRITLPRALCVCALVGLLGCGHMLESKAITQFTEALEQKDFEQLRSATSSKFEERALRTTEALDDFKIVNLPKGETTVVEVQDSSETEKLVTVTAGKLKSKLFYKLVKDGDSDRWVVDDVYVRQRKGGVKVDKYVPAAIARPLGAAVDPLSVQSRPGDRSGLAGGAGGIS